jgi:hypothetical protein
VFESRLTELTVQHRWASGLGYSGLPPRQGQERYTCQRTIVTEHAAAVPFHDGDTEERLFPNEDGRLFKMLVYGVVGLDSPVGVVPRCRACRAGHQRRSPRYD